MTIVLGITGGIGSGKSTVASLLASCGALVLDADEAARAVATEPEILKAVRERFGAEVFGEDGFLDRARLAAEVFGPGRSAARRDLEAIMHPAIRERMGRSLAAARREERAVVVLDVPLLHDSPFLQECDAIWHVESDPEERRKRVAARGWSAEELDRREQAQLELDEKSRRADLRIQNKGDLDQLRAQVEALYRNIIADQDGAD